MVDSADVPRVDGIEGLTPVGRGGFATVYRGHQPAFRREVAVKVLQRSSLDSDDRRRFERECQAMGALSGHPAIVTLYDAGFTADGRPYLVMPYFPDGTLQDRLADGPMTWQEVAALGIHVAGALETAHRAGVIHRDVKPGNVLRSEYGNQISDFGIARLQGGHETQSGVVTASIAHAAPEILDGHPPTELADVYSLGSTLYQALVGRAAFTQGRDETLLALVRRVLTEPIPDLRDRGVPSALATTVECAMAKDPGARYATAEAFGRALQHAQAALGLHVTDLVIVGERPGPAAGAMPAAAVPRPGTVSATTSPPQIPETSGSPVEPMAASVETLAMPDNPSAAMPPSKRSGPTRWVLPLAIGGIVALLIAAFALWPRTSSDDGAFPPTGLTVVTEPASGAAPATSVVASNPDPTVADQSPTTISATTVPPTRSEPTAAVVASVADVANTTTVDGFPFTGIDGISHDRARDLLLAAKEPAPSAIADPTPGLVEPAVFAIPMDIGASSDVGLDFVSASAAPLTRADGAPYGPELDIEGMAVLDDDTFFVVSEGSGELDSTGGPFVHRFEPDGRFRSALALPEWYLSDQSGTRGFTPRRGLHGIDTRPGFAGQVVVAVEAPLVQDHDPGDPTERKVARLIAFDASTGDATAEWGYPLSRISPAAVAARPNAASLIVDIARLDDDSIVVLESTWTDPGTQVFVLYRVDLDDGSAPAATVPRTVEKTPIAVSGTGVTDSLPPVASVTNGPALPDGEGSLILATDNAFDDVPTQILVLRLESEG